MESNKIPESITKDPGRLGEMMTVPPEDFRKASDVVKSAFKIIAELNQDIKEFTKIPESTLAIIHDAQKSYNDISDTINSLVSKFPKIDIPSIAPIDFRQNEIVIPPRIDPEKNEWKRHDESLKVQNSILKIQTGILEEQQSNSKLSNKIFYLSIAGIIISVISVVVTAAGILSDKAAK